MEDLVKKAKKRDEEAFSKLIIAEKASLYKIAISRMQTIEDAEDILQETVIDAFAGIHKIKKNESFESWIRQILINKIKNFYKREEAKNKKIKEKAIENFQKENMDKINNIIKTEKDLDFKRLLDKLNEEERTIVLLLFNDRYKEKDISKMLNIKYNTLKTKISRIKIKVKTMIERGDKIG